MYLFVLMLLQLSSLASPDGARNNGLVEQTAQNTSATTTRHASISGTVVNSRNEPIPEASVDVLRKLYWPGPGEMKPSRGESSAITDKDGKYRLTDLLPGHYYVMASRAERTGDVGHYAPTLYPSSYLLSSGQIIKVKQGEQVSEINIVMRDWAAFSITGRVADPAGDHLTTGARLVVYPEVDWGWPQASAISGRDGSFAFEPLPPGRYRTHAELKDLDSSQPPAVITKFLDIVDRDLTGVTFSFGPKVYVRGRVKVEGGTVPANLGVRLFTLPNDWSRQSFYGKVKTDGTFELSGVLPGTYEIEFIDLPRPQSSSSLPVITFFFNRTITLDNTEVKDTAIILPEGMASAEITATIDARMGAVSGRVAQPATTGSGQHIAVALISTDPDKRASDRYFLRFNTDSTGAFNFGQLTHVIPGDYFLVAIAGNDPGMLRDSDVLSMVEKHLVRVSVPPEGKVVQNLTLLPTVEDVGATFSPSPR